MTSCLGIYIAAVQDLVCDVRSQPTEAPSVVNGHDRGRLTQVLRGDCVHVLEENDEWCFIEVPSQLMGQAVSSPQPYKGWVLKSALRPSDRCRCILQDAPGVKSRHAIVQEALSFIGQPYVWGGMSRSAQPSSKCTTGIDCSGLVHTCYKKNGIVLPRDSIDQHASMISIPWQDLEPADCIFSTNAAGRITHVMLWDGEQIIEATDQGRAIVRRIPFEERFGLSMRHLQACGPKALYFCRYMTEFV